MKIKSILALASAGFAIVSTIHATSITEDFSHNPALDGWQVFGDTNLFTWDSTNHVLDVTWDSSQTNSYFYLPLDTIMDTNDDFSMSFDLVLYDYAIGVNPEQPDTFAVSTGFLNLSEATGDGFLRGGYPSQTNLAEFDFFQWDTETPYPATNSVSPTFIDNQNDFAYNTYGVVELPTNVVMRVTLSFTTADQTAVVTVTTNGVALVEPSYAYLTNDIYGAFGNFQLDTFAVESYSDVDSDASLLAHGTIGNILLVVPPPPVTFLQAALTNGVGQVQFSGLTNWTYVLQSSANLQNWLPAGPVVNGTNGIMVLQDTNTLQPHQFYRVNAQKAD